MGASITNGSFETGSTDGWIILDNPDPFEPLTVSPAGTVNAFDGFVGPNVVIPSDGEFALTHGFDGGIFTISVAQDIGIIDSTDTLTFDYRAGWDLLSFSFPGASDRHFSVAIEPAGGGEPLGVFDILTAPIDSDTGGVPNSDTGPLSEVIPLSDFAGVDARVNFLWEVPDSFSGPANAQLDNVSVPEPLNILGSLLVLFCGVLMKKKAL